MFLTVRPGKVYTDNGGRRYPAGSEIDVDNKKGESLIRNEVATWSEHPKWRAANFKLRAIKIKTANGKGLETDDIFNTLEQPEAANGEEAQKTVLTEQPAEAQAVTDTPIEQPKKRMGRPPKNKE